MKRMILNPISMFTAGLLLGVISRLLDIYTENLGNIFSQLAIWILTGTLIAIYSDTKKKAMFNILPFCIGMLITYYFAAFVSKGVYSDIYIVGWTVFALLSPIMAYFAWMSKEKGVFSIIFRVGIVAVSLLSSIVFFDRLRVYDFIIAAALIYFLFFAKVKRSINIRLETKKDERTVENLVRESFWNVYRPGAYEHYVLHVQRKHPDFVNELNFVVEKDGEIIGQSVFVKSKIIADNGEEIPTLTLGPICIANEYKRQGYGKILLDFAFEKATELGFGAVLFEGNIDFYGKCGCVKASDCGIRYHGMPDGEEAEFFLCKILKDGYLDGVVGEYSSPEVYYVEDDDVEAFDKTFPVKKKLKLPGQLS